MYAYADTSMTDDQIRRMSYAEFEWWLSREAFERTEWAKAAGYCCWAGAVADPHPCPWHPNA